MSGDTGDIALTRSAGDERRPWRTLFVCDWVRALFIHYEVDPVFLQPQIPFALDTREGRAYVSLVAFTIVRLRPACGGRLAAQLVSPIATHEFLNVRTYVRHDGKPGIYFMSEWLPNRLSVLLGPRTFGLPYRLGRLQYVHDHERGVLRGAVESARGPGRLAYEAHIAPDACWRACAPGSLPEFLLERYTAFTRHGRARRLFRIRHAPWLQAPVGVDLLDDRLARLTGAWFLHAWRCCAQYSPGVTDVRISFPQRIHSHHEQPENGHEDCDHGWNGVRRLASGRGARAVGPQRGDHHAGSPVGRRARRIVAAAVRRARRHRRR